MSIDTESDASSRIEAVVAAVSEWPGISLVEGRSGGRTVRLGPREIGTLRYAGTLTITYPVVLHEALVDAGWAAPDPLAPVSGRTVFRVRSGADIERALSLLRVSYLFHALRRSDTPEGREALDAVDVPADLDHVGAPYPVREFLVKLAGRPA
ncbi:luciferase domain-containing protein [Halomarina litorea]|uniref:luciferase domain-containing protein n=1 Tax=Halomarina litorea TaxID=2961595 RepID=UPI0020C46DDD|nr:luciferase family protein [Halomarina sp. BCD28]